MYRKQTTLRMEKELYDKLAQMARLHMRSVSDMLRIILARNVDKYKES